MSREFEWRNYKFEIERRSSGIRVKSGEFQATLNQLKVLALISEGLAGREIASTTERSPNTVYNHLKALRKRNATDFRQPTTLNLVIEAERRGLLYPLTLIGIKVLAESLPFS